MNNNQLKKYNAIVHNNCYAEKNDSGKEKDVFAKCPSCNEYTKWNNGAYWFGKNLKCSHCEQFSYYDTFKF